MPRPSMKQQRTEEILQAFARCVARYGLDGSTLERIAEEAGMLRPLVRHFVGNREELEQQLAQRAIQLSQQSWHEFLQYMEGADGAGGAEYLLQGLFAESGDDSEQLQVTEALVLASRSRPWLQQLMGRWLTDFEMDIRRLLSKEYPQQPDSAIKAVSFGLISLYLNLDSIVPLNQAENYRESAMEAAIRLLTSLEVVNA